MAQTIKMIFQFRRDTAENWLANKDVVPASGEPCFVIDRNVLKIGDGETTFENLPAIGGVSAEIAADGSSVVLEDGVFKLIGFDAAEVGAQPRKNAEGKLEWVVPSTETVEGLQTAVEELATKVETLETQMDGIDAQIDAKINAWANAVTDDDEVNTVVEFIDYVKNHGGEAATMAADIANLQQLVGEDSVKEQISAAIEGIQPGDAKIEAIKLGSTLLDIVDKTVVIPVGAGLKASEEILIEEDGTLKIGSVGMSKLFSDDTEIFLNGGSASGK